MHKLARWLKDREISLSEFAPRVGVTHAQLSRVINERRRPSHRLMARIQHETEGEVTPNDWFEESAA